MTLCDKKNPCATCKWAWKVDNKVFDSGLICSHQQRFYHGTLEDIDFEKMFLFGCCLWELCDNLLDEQKRINAVEKLQNNG
jgi:hypothetical protein